MLPAPAYLDASASVNFPFFSTVKYFTTWRKSYKYVVIYIFQYVQILQVGGLRSHHTCLEETQRSILWRKHEHVYYSLIADILLNLIMQNCAGNSCYLFLLSRPLKNKQTNKQNKNKNGKKMSSCSDLIRLKNYVLLKFM